MVAIRLYVVAVHLGDYGAQKDPFNSLSVKRSSVPLSVREYQTSFPRWRACRRSGEQHDRIKSAPILWILILNEPAIGFWY